MLGALLSAVVDPQSVVPHAAKRIGILLAAIVLLWSAVFAGMIGLVFAGHAWLAARTGQWGAWAIASAAVGCAGALGIWLSMRAIRPHLGGGVEPQDRLIDDGDPLVSLSKIGDLVGAHPVEAVCLAATAGVLVSGADLEKLIDQLLTHAVRPR